MLRKSIFTLTICFFCLISLFLGKSIGNYSIEKDTSNGVAKFSGEGEDFSIDQAIYFCPFDAACGGSKLYERLSIMRQVREQVLKPTKIGKKYALMFSRYGSELARLVLENPELAEGTRDLIRLLVPIATDLLTSDFTNKNILLDRMDATKIKIISVSFEEKASPELRKAIIETRFELDDFVDKNVEEIFAFLNGGKISEEIMKLKELLPKNPLVVTPAS